MRHPRPIGSAGTSARIIVGAVLLGIVLQGELSTGGLSPPSLAFGLVGLPALVLAWQWLGARRIPARLEATKPWDFALNIGAGCGALPHAVVRAAARLHWQCHALLLWGIDAARCLAWLRRL